MWLRDACAFHFILIIVQSVFLFFSIISLFPAFFISIVFILDLLMPNMLHLCSFVLSLVIVGHHWLISFLIFLPVLLKQRLFLHWLSHNERRDWFHLAVLIIFTFIFLRLQLIETKLNHANSFCCWKSSYNSIKKHAKMSQNLFKAQIIPGYKSNRHKIFRLKIFKHKWRTKKKIHWLIIDLIFHCNRHVC